MDECRDGHLYRHKKTWNIIKSILNKPVKIKKLISKLFVHTYLRKVTCRIISTSSSFKR